MLDRCTSTEHYDIPFALALDLQFAYLTMNIPIPDHLSTKITKHLTSPCDNISIFCYFVIKGDTIEGSRNKFEKHKRTWKRIVKINVIYNKTKKYSQLRLKGGDRLVRDSPEKLCKIWSSVTIYL